MIGGKLVWIVVVLFTTLKGCAFLNTTQEIIKSEVPFPNATQVVTKQEREQLHTSVRVEAPPNIEILPANTNTSKEILETAATATQNSISTSNKSTSANQTRLEVAKIFEEDFNISTGIWTEQVIVNTTVTNYQNVSSVDLTCIDQSWNDTFKTNYTTVAEAIGASEGNNAFQLQNTAAVAAGVFLVSAIVGYFSCVGYRRFLQRKYGNSRILVGEEVYDTTDLRYFEI